MFDLFKRKSASTPNRRDIARSRQQKFEQESGGSDDYQVFRRSRTLTGSASSSVRTLNEPGAHLKSPRVHAHTLMRTRRHMGLILFAIIIACGVLYGIVSQFTATVTVTINDSASVEPKADYAKAVQDYLAGAPLERLRFLVNNDALKHALQAQYPEIAGATLQGGDGLGNAEVALTMRQPVAEWTVGGQNEYVDNSGTPFKTNYYNDPSVKIIDKSGIRPKDDQSLISNAFLGFVGQVVGISKSLENLTVTAITIPPDTTREIEVSVSGVPYPIRLSTDRSVGDQVEDMTRTIAWMQKNNKTPNYVDVRVSGEAFYQ